MTTSTKNTKKHSTKGFAFVFAVVAALFGAGCEGVEGGEEGTEQAERSDELKGAIDTSTLGAGSLPTECKEGMEKDKSDVYLCYPKCSDGYFGQVTRCIMYCGVQEKGAYEENPGVCKNVYKVPNGGTDFHYFTPDSYDRGAGKPPTVCAAGMVKVNGLCYQPKTGG